MFSKKSTLKVVVAFISLVMITSCSSEDAIAKNSSNQNAKSQDILLEVYKSPNCGCCKKWISHIDDNGFQSNVHNRQDTSVIKDKLGIKPNLRSCHTAISSDGYAFEGHIPAKFIKQFLNEKHSSDVMGLTVPGMPLGIPGMEVGDQFQPYNVLLLKVDGSHEVYANVQSYEEQF